MKRLLLIKSGDTARNTFSYVGDDFNNPLIHNEIDLFSPPSNTIYNFPTFSFFNRTPFTYQLVTNVHGDSPDNLAISHHMTNLHNPPNDPNLFHPLYLDELMKYADMFSTVIYGAVQSGEVITANNTLSHIRAFARNPTTGDIIDLDVNAAVDPPPGQDSIHIVALFSIVKIESLPVYCIITDPKLLTISTVVDVTDDNICIRVLKEYDGTIRDNLITPDFSSNVELISDNILFVSERDTFDIDLFTRNTNFFRMFNIPIDNIPVKHKSINIWTQYDNGKITAKFHPNQRTGFIKIKLQGGSLFDNPTSPESLLLSYAILR